MIHRPTRNLLHLARIAAVAGVLVAPGFDARGQEALSTIVRAAPRDAAMPVFRPPYILDSHKPAEPVTNIYGGPQVDQNASVATDGAGTWISVWHSSDTLRDTIGRDFDILFSRSTDEGLTWTPHRTLNTTAAKDKGDDLAPFVRTDESGTWIVAWTSNDTFGGRYGLDRDVFFARSTDNGETWSDPAPLNANAASDWGEDREVRLATDGSGNWLAVWSSTDSLGNRLGGDSDILFARSTDNGETWSYPMPLNTNAGVDKGFDTSPEVVTDASGRWIVVWSSGDATSLSLGTDRDILMSRSDDAGVSWTDPAPLNSNATSDANSDWSPRIASDGRGNWVAVWSSADTLGDTIGFDRDILVSYSADNGTTWTPARALNLNAAFDAREDSAPTIASDGLGNWLVAWHAWGGLSYRDGSDADIAIAFSADNAQSWSSPVHINRDAATDDVDDLFPAIATDGAGNWVAVWQSFNPPDESSKVALWRILAANGTMPAEHTRATGAGTDAAAASQRADGEPPAASAP